MSSFTFNKTWNNNKWTIVNFLHNILNFSWNDGVLTLLRGGGFFEKQRFSHTLIDYRTSIPYPTHYILIVEGQIGHLNILCIYDTHSGGPSATHRTNREGGVVFSSFFAIWPIFQLFFSFVWRTIRWMLPLHMETTHVPLSNFATLATYIGH